MAAHVTAKKKNNHRRLAGGLVACAAAVLAVVGVTAFAASNVPDPTPDPDKAYTAISTPTYDEQKNALFKEQLTDDSGAPLVDASGNPVMGYVDGKEALWTDEEKEHADIVISYKRDINRALFLASLCSAHGLASGGTPTYNLEKELSEVAKIAKLDVYFEGNDFLGDTINGQNVYQTVSGIRSRVTNQHAHYKLDELLPASDTIDLSKIENEYRSTSPLQTITVSQNTNSVTSQGQHFNVRQFADDIIEALSVPDDKKPDFIVLSFDAWVWAVGSASQEKADDAKVMMQAAKLLEPYYKNNAVVWLTDNTYSQRPGLGTITNYIDTPGTAREHYFHYLYPRTKAEFDSKDNETTWTNPPSATAYWEAINPNTTPPSANVSNYSDLHFGGTYRQGTGFSSTLEREHFLRWSVAKGETTSYEWISGFRMYGAATSNTGLRGDPNMLSYYTLSRKFPFYQYALLNPTKYLQYVDNDTGAMLDEADMPGGQLPQDIIDWDLASLNVPTAYYGEPESAVDIIRAKVVDYDYYVLEDTLAPGLVYEGISLEYLNETKNEWISFTDDDNDYVVEEPSDGNQKVKVTINAQAEDLVKDKRVRLTIHTRCDDTFFADSDAAQGNDSDAAQGNTASNHQAAKETNIEASAHVTFNDTANNVTLHRTATEFDSPVLRKTRPVVEVKGSKTWNDGKNVEGKRPSEVYLHIAAVDKDGNVLKDKDGNYIYDALPARKATQGTTVGEMEVWNQDENGKEIVWGSQTGYVGYDADGNTVTVYASYQDLVNNAAGGDASKVHAVHDSTHPDNGKTTGVKYAVDQDDGSQQECYVDLLWGYDTWVSDVNGTRKADDKKVDDDRDKIYYVVWESLGLPGTMNDIDPVPGYIEDVPHTEADAEKIDYAFGGGVDRTDYEVRYVDYNLTNTLEIKLDAQKIWEGDYFNDFKTRQNLYMYVDATYTGDDDKRHTIKGILPEQKIAVDNNAGDDAGRKTPALWGGKVGLSGEITNKTADAAKRNATDKRIGLVTYEDAQGRPYDVNVLPRFDANGKEIVYSWREETRDGKAPVGYTVTKQPKWSTDENAPDENIAKAGPDDYGVVTKTGLFTNKLVTKDYVIHKRWISHKAPDTDLFLSNITIKAKSAAGSNPAIDVDVYKTKEDVYSYANSSGKAFEGPDETKEEGATPGIHVYTYTWKDLPAYMGVGKGDDAPPVAVDYSTTEAQLSTFKALAPTYENRTAEDTKALHGGIVTNIQTFDIAVEKKWDDASDQDGHRPESITVELFRNGESQGTKTVSGTDDTWTSTVWTDLPYADSDNNVYQYTVVEKKAEPYTKVDIGAYAYEWNADGNTCTFKFDNAHDPELVTITATKVWDDNNNRDGKRTQVQLRLLADGVAATTDAEGKAITNPVSVANGSNFDEDLTATWANMQRYKKNAAGNDVEEIVYTVKEVEVPEGYTVRPVQVGAGCWEVINSHTTASAGSYTVAKKWDDNNNHDGKRPQSVDVQLFQAQEGVQPVSYGDQQTLSDSNNWTYVYTDLPESDTNGVGFTYYVRELDSTGSPLDVGAQTADGYTVSYDESGSSCTITNTLNDENVTVTAIKNWDDAGVAAAADLHTDVTLHLYGKLNGQVVYDAGTQTIAKGSNAEATWEDLPKYHYSTTPLEWEIVEEAVFGFAASYKWDSDGLICEVVNTYVGPVAEVTVSKKWNDDANNDRVRPPQLTYVLQQKVGSAEATDFDTQTVQVAQDAAGEATYTWKDLPVVTIEQDANGNDVEVPILYSVREEDPGAGYTYHMEALGPGQFLAVNTREPDTTSIFVTKLWDGDDDDADGKRPGSITVNVLDGTDVVRTATVSGSSWTATIDGLPKNRGGSPIAYTVEEVTSGLPHDYAFVSVAPDGNGGFLITNKYVPETITVEYLDADGKTIIKETIKKGGAEPAAPENPTREGYTFAGWDRTTDADGNVTYTPNWSQDADPETIEVEYIGPDGSIQKTTIKRGEDEPDAPEAPTREGYTFAGWERTVDADGNVTYTAQWIAVPTADKTVIYVDAQADDSLLSTDGTKPEDPSHEGFVFDGWKETIDPNGNVVYTARYKPVPATPTVSYVDGQAENPLLSSDGTKPADPSHSGLAFVGWEEVTDSAGNTVFVARYASDCANVAPTPQPEPEPEPQPSPSPTPTPSSSPTPTPSPSPQPNVRTTPVPAGTSASGVAVQATPKTADSAPYIPAAVVLVASAAAMALSRRRLQGARLAPAASAAARAGKHARKEQVANSRQ